MQQDEYPSTGKEWEKYSIEIQVEIDTILAELQLDIEAAVLELNILLKEDPEKVSKRASEIVSYLDSKWPYIGDMFMVSGKWYYPNVMVNTNGLLCTYNREEVLTVAKSNGFMVAPIHEDDEEAISIGLSFITNTLTVSTPYIQGMFQALAFAKLNEIGLQFLRSKEANTIGSSIEEVIDGIQSAEALLIDTINNENTHFFTIPAKEQGVILEHVIATANNSLPQAYTLERAIVLDMHVTEIYVPDNTNRHVTVLKGSKNALLTINRGVLLGYTTLDTFIDGAGSKRYTTPQQMHTTHTGLCAIIKPLEYNFDLGQRTGTDIIVPIRKAVNGVSISLEVPE